MFGQLQVFLLSLLIQEMHRHHEHLLTEYLFRLRIRQVPDFGTNIARKFSLRKYSLHFSDFQRAWFILVKQGEEPRILCFFYVFDEPNGFFHFFDLLGGWSLLVLTELLHWLLRGHPLLLLGHLHLHLRLRWTLRLHPRSRPTILRLLRLGRHWRLEDTRLHIWGISRKIQIIQILQLWGDVLINSRCQGNRLNGHRCC